MRPAFRSIVVSAIAIAALVVAALPVSTQTQRPRSPFDGLRFRDIGPAVTSGRMHDVQMDPANPSIVYVATASGGIWKTTNKGTTWDDIFGDQNDNTFGALAIYPKNTQIVWAGTGEQNNRQSSSWGGGVYRSTDGGATWSYLGLHDTRSIGRVVLDPNNPDVAYIAAVGNLWAPSEDRGVYKTTDAGRNWTKVLYVDTFTGATDLVMDPRDANVLYAATYQRQRSTCCYNGGGPGSAIYKSLDAGKTWAKIENGIPAGDKGRIGLAIAMSKPDVLVATIEHSAQGAGGTYRSEDAGMTWKRMSGTNPRPMYYSKPTIDPNDDRHIWLPGVSIVHSKDAGATWIEEPTSAAYDLGLKTDHHVLRVDPANSNHIYVAGDGGLHESWDMGRTYVRHVNIPVAQIYRVAVDDREFYNVYAGLQDNHSWMGPSATRHWLGILNQDWKEIGFSDGTGKAVDVKDPRKVYSSSSGGNLSLVDPETGDTIGITPRPGPGEPAYRFDWDAPVLASRHTSGTVYLGGNRLFISRDFGSSWTPTKDLTRSLDRNTVVMMGVPNSEVRLSRNDGDNISEISNIAESPLDANILWVGTDDGNVQVTTDGGKTWTEVSAAIAGVKNGTFVGDIVASSASKGTAFVSFDAHRDGDFKAYLFRTSDFGKTWTAVTTGLPGDDASIRGLAEFPGKPNVLFAGTERALFVTHDAGAHWARLKANLPTTRIDDIVIHPRTKDLVLGTHGRGVWILDDATPVAEWTPVIAAERAHLFDVPVARLMLYWEDVSNMAQGFYASPNPVEGAVFTYSLGQRAERVRLTVTNAAGRVMREISGPVEAGVLQRVNWDLRFALPAGAGRGGGGGGEEGGGGGGAGSTGVNLPIPAHDLGARGAHVAPGSFKVTLEVDGQAAGSKTFEVRADSAIALTAAEHKARETFVIDVLDQQARAEALAKEIGTRRASAQGPEADRITALEQRLGAAAGGRGRGGRGGGAPAGPAPVRQRLGTLLNTWTISGTQTGTMAAPSAALRNQLEEAKRDLAAIEKELRGK